MKKTVILFSVVLFCLFGFTSASNFRTVNSVRSAKISPTIKISPRIDGEYTICNDGRTYTYTISGLEPGDDDWTWTVSGKVVFSSQNTGTSVDIMYDPSTSGSYTHGVLQAFRPDNSSLTRHFDIVTCP
jgi:hypothetical protein